ncbi:MAG: hypothetical protein Mars2KO_45080 [Maribacter sp.]|uniref:hypothetical protein n=1 Tax=Maribacter sp. 2307UL18-2 TaxID=3386274 RepID=UPI0039BD0674
MSHKIKSALYFSSLVLAVMTYYSIDTTETIENTQLVENTIEQISTDDVLN